MTANDLNRPLARLIAVQAVRRLVEEFPADFQTTMQVLQEECGGSIDVGLVGPLIGELAAMAAVLAHWVDGDEVLSPLERCDAIEACLWAAEETR